MKKKLLFVLLILGIFSVFAQSMDLQKSFTLLNNGKGLVEIEFNEPDYEINNVLCGDGHIYSFIKTSSEAYTTEVGMPYLPIFATGIAIENKGKVNVEFIASDYYEMNLENQLYPAQEEGFSTVIKNNSLDKISALYPENSFNVSKPFILRDYRVLPITIKPFQYDAQKNKLRIVKNLKLIITTDQNQKGTNEKEDSRFVSSAFSNIYQNSILNYSKDRGMNFDSNVLILYKSSNDNQFETQINQLIKYKRQKGFHVYAMNTVDIGSNSAEGIKNYIQNLYNGNELVNGSEFRPDFLILVGDCSGSHGIPAFCPSYALNGEGDYPYTLLAGDDTVGDVIIGRLSVNNAADLARYNGKIKQYEVLSNPDNDDYMGRMLLVADTDPSGESTKNNCKYIKQISSAIYPDYEYIELYSNEPSVAQVNQAFNRGVGIYNYRGIAGMSGWNPGPQTNVNKTPHSVMITCGTGNYAGTSTTEEFMNMGSAASPKGALTAIGMTTSHTHTSYNNTLCGGIFQEIITNDARNIGAGLLNGKAYLNLVYAESAYADVKKFSHWCNLIGDPTTEVFIGIPTYLKLETTELREDQDFIIVLKDEDDNLVADANVSITYVDGTILNQYTSQNGTVTFSIDSPQNMVQITANKSGYHPIQQVVQASNSNFLSVSSIMINDENGNNNGVINSGEEININFIINNLSDVVAENVSASLSVNSNYVTVNNNGATINQIEGNSSSAFSTNFSITVANDIPNLLDIIFNLSLTYNNDTEENLMYSSTVSSGDIKVLNSELEMNDNSLEANEHALVTCLIKNDGNENLSNLQAKLVINNGFFNVVNDVVDLQTVNTSEEKTFQYDIFSSVDLFGGMTANCILKFINGENFYQEHHFVLTFGEGSEGEPLGPDPFGYVIYDSFDNTHSECPEYDWIEISPRLGGLGTALDIQDMNGNGEGDIVGANSTSTIELPFDFSFYGNNYHEITVCSNGYISFGENTNGEFRNYRLPGALGPNGMIAPFWDNLYTTSQSRICTYYDQSIDAFIVEWDNLVNGSSNHQVEETFQIILYNPATNPSTQGQGQIKIQYKEIDNCDDYTGDYTPWHANYATVGIESPDGSMGLEYTYNNNYPVTCHSLQNEMALFITSKPIQVVEPFIIVGDIVINDENGVLESNERIDFGVSLQNRAITPVSNVQATIHCNNPNVNIIQNHANYGTVGSIGDFWGNQNFTIETNNNFSNGEKIDLFMSLTGDNQFSCNRNFALEVAVPDLTFGNITWSDYSTNGNNDGIPNAGETVQFQIEIINNSLIDVTLNRLNFNSNSEHISTLSNHKDNINLSADSSTLIVFDANIASDVVDETEIDFSFSMINETDIIDSEQNILVIGNAGISCDFETESESCITELNSPWSIGNCSWMNAHSGENVLTNSVNGSYPNNMNATAWTQYFFVHSNSEISFWHMYDFERNYDGGRLVIQCEDDNSIHVIVPDNGYPYSHIMSLDSGAGYSGNQSSWEKIIYTVESEFANKNIRLGFLSVSDSYMNSSGWFIDDIEVSGLSREYTLFAGDVELIGGNPDDIDKTKIIIGKNETILNSDSEYKCILSRDNHSINFVNEGYSVVTHELSSYSFNSIQSYTAHLYWLNKPENLVHSINDNEQLILNWDYETDSDNELVDFMIQRKLGVAPWEDYLTVPGTSTQALQQLNGSDNGLHKIRVIAHYQNGNSKCSNTIEYTFHSTGNEENVTELITDLKGNYPNPFNPETTIAYSIKESAKVSLNVYNIRGQLVKTLVNEIQDSGSHSVVWQGKNDNNKSVASGIYFYRLKSIDCNKTRKCILLK